MAISTEAPETTTRTGLAQPVDAGVVTALVGFTSSSAVVLTGLRAVGATPAQAASGLMAVCLTQGIGMMLLSRRYRIPITLAWSTPGAALLAGTGAVAGGWATAVGAFLAVGLLIVATGFWERLGRLVATIPTELAQAMLAGVLLPLCLAPVKGLHISAAAVAPVIITWIVMQRWAKRWAVPAAFGIAAVVIAVGVTTGHKPLRLADMVPSAALTVPHWSLQALIGIAIPLYIVTMAAQNIPGVAVMASFEYHVPWRAAMTTTGIGTLIGAVAGGYTINLAAISAALAAAPSAHPDRDRRWIAAFTAGVSYLVLGLGSAALVALVAVAPAAVLATVAGLALLPTLAGALAGAVGKPETRESAIVTFAVAASGISLFGVGAALWALVAGLIMRWVTRRGGGLAG